MAVPVWSVGQVLTASDVNQWFVPLAAIKPSDQSVTNSAAVVNDTALFLTLAANASYEFKVAAAATGPALNTGDIKFDLTWPSGTALLGGFGFAVSASVTPVFTNITSISGGQNWLGVNGANLSPVNVEGVVQVGVTSGTLQFQWAQFTANATATVLKAGSAIRAWRIG